MYRVTKKYGHDLGLSAAFRQWRADSHCHFVHGYALSVTLVFETEELDEKNWVIDFGALKPIKQFLIETFDHKTLVAEDDPHLSKFVEMNDLGLIDLHVVPHVGCEKFAEIVYDFVDNWLYNTGQKPRVSLTSVEVAEHGANSATVNSSTLMHKHR